MKIEDILRQLKKEKEPLKYLQKLLKSTKDEKLKKAIEKLIKKLRKGEKPKAKIPSLEQIAQTIAVPQRQVQTETLEVKDYPPRRRSRVMVGVGDTASQEDNERQEDYGANVKSDYILTSDDRKKSLETAGLTTRSGSMATAESKEAARRNAGDKYQGDADYNANDVELYNARSDQLADDRALHKRKEKDKKGTDIEVYYG